jgi:hypothetical protein
MENIVKGTCGMKLFEFAFCQNYNVKIAALAGMCPEKWSFGATPII